MFLIVAILLVLIIYLVTVNKTRQNWSVIGDLIKKLRIIRSVFGIRSKDEINVPPGSLGLPILGETLQFIVNGANGKFFNDRTKRHGKIYKTHLFGKPTVRICDLDHVRLVLMNEHSLVVGMWPPSFQALMGPGALSMSSANAHRFKKRMLIETFRKENLVQLFPLIQCTTQTKTCNWAGTSVDIYESVKDVAFTCTCQILLGINPSAGDITNLSEYFQEFIQGIFAIPINMPGFALYKATKAKKSICLLLQDLLSKENSSKSSGLLQIYLSKCMNKNGKNIDMDEMLDIALELLFGGQETSTSVLTQFIILMEQHPSVLQKVRNEVDEMFNKADAATQTDAIDMDRISSLVYTKAVIKEILRLFPPIGGGFREVIKTFQLGDYVIPKGWAITYAISETHTLNSNVEKIINKNRNHISENNNNIHTKYSEVSNFCSGGNQRVKITNKNYVTAPISKKKTKFESGIVNNNIDTDILKFNPDRWTEGAQKLPYIPFGIGARSCVGKEYAILLIQTFIIYVVRDLDWDIVNDLKDINFLTVPVRRPEKPVMCRFKLKK